MIKIYIEDISKIDSKEKFNFIFSSLPKHRQEKVLSYKQDKDRYLSLLAGKLLCDGLVELGLEECINKIEIEPNGKPFINGNPIFFSISHSGTKAMVVFSDAEVGCDIQLIKEDSIKLADNFFSYEEQLEIKNSDSPTDSFFKFWTLKECYMKISGKGLSSSIKNINTKDESYISNTYRLDNYMVAYVCKK